VARGSKLPAIGENSRLIQTTVCMSNLLIREARPDDAPVLLAAEKETARTPGLLVSRPHELTLQAFEQKIAELAQRGRYIVAEEDGRIAGHALLDPMPLEAISHVFRLTIGSSRIYRPGIGTALLLITGIWNYVQFSKTYDLAKTYHMVLGIKILAAIVVFLLAALLAGRTNAAETIRKKWTLWLDVCVVLAIVTVVR